jgi:hypothetical protein
MKKRQEEDDVRVEEFWTGHEQRLFCTFVDAYMEEFPEEVTKFPGGKVFMFEEANVAKLLASMDPSRRPSIFTRWKEEVEEEPGSKG